ncbi:MAG TPA: ester cyclase [Gemmatimonadales bacterium]|nr:ester cyclase [Gemmatimonadales bacterium]
MAQATTLSPQALVTAAKALIEAYNDKDWDRARASITPDFLYDEVPTGRKVTGSDEALEIWKGWAGAFPDSRGVFHAAHVAEGATVVLEVSWMGTHQGPLPTPAGPIPATGRPIAVRACIVIEIADERARSQRHYFDMATLMQQLGVGGS